MSTIESITIGANRPVTISAGMPNDYLPIFAGPCLVESAEVLRRVAEELLRLESLFPVRFVFKSSFRKANRTSASGFSGIGDEKALELLMGVREDLGLAIITDIHSPEDARKAAEAADVLQIPAFLARQTDLLLAAAATGKAINIKKGQFMAPADMEYAAEKISQAGNEKILLCERGTFFGYGDLVVDMRSIDIMRRFGRPVVFDATHSVQRPSQSGQSSGERQFILPLAKAAIAAGADALFLETHPDPASARSDRDSQLQLDQLQSFLENVTPLWQAVQPLKAATQNLVSGS